MKMSNFNFFYDFPEEQKVLAYNSRTSALALMEKENFKSLDNYIENPSASNLDDTLMQDLKRGGFILEDNIDELELLKYGLLSR
ncbi:MAG: hypothetical protein E6Z15_22780, partial [Paenibacillus macerans]|nr:hypothetical protein [Paenibacillus macerans]